MIKTLIKEGPNGRFVGHVEVTRKTLTVVNHNRVTHDDNEKKVEVYCISGVSSGTTVYVAAGVYKALLISTATEAERCVERALYVLANDERQLNPEEQLKAKGYM